MSALNVALPDWGLNDLLSLPVVIGYEERENSKLFKKATHTFTEGQRTDGQADEGADSGNSSVSVHSIERGGVCTCVRKIERHAHSDDCFWYVQILGSDTQVDKSQLGALRALSTLGGRGNPSNAPAACCNEGQQHKPPGHHDTDVVSHGMRNN